MLAKVVFTGLAVVALAAAQGMGGSGGGQMGDPSGGGGGGRGRGGGGGGDMGGGMGMGGMRPVKPSKADQMAARLKLTDDQKAEFNTILEATFKDATGVVQQLLK